MNKFTSQLLPPLYSSSFTQPKKPTSGGFRAVYIKKRICLPFLDLFPPSSHQQEFLGLLPLAFLYGYLQVLDDGVGVLVSLGLAAKVTSDGL